MISEDDIRSVAKRFAEAIDAEQVILFGSHARMEAGPNSDVDLLVIAKSDLPRHKRTRDLYKLIRPYPFGMDLLVYTPAEIERGMRSRNSFVSRVLREGKTIYAR